MSFASSNDGPVSNRNPCAACSSSRPNPAASEPLPFHDFHCRALQEGRGGAPPTRAFFSNSTTSQSGRARASRPATATPLLPSNHRAKQGLDRHLHLPILPIHALFHALSPDSTAHDDNPPPLLLPGIALDARGGPPPGGATSFPKIIPRHAATQYRRRSRERCARRAEGVRCKLGAYRWTPSSTPAYIRGVPCAARRDRDREDEGRRHFDGSPKNSGRDCKKKY